MFTFLLNAFRKLVGGTLVVAPPICPYVVSDSTKAKDVKSSTNIITGTIKITIRGLFLILIAVCSRRSSSIIISLSNGYEHLFVVIYQVYIQVS